MTKNSDTTNKVTKSETQWREELEFVYILNNKNNATNSIGYRFFLKHEGYCFLCWNNEIGNVFKRTKKNGFNKNQKYFILNFTSTLSINGIISFGPNWPFVTACSITGKVSRDHSENRGCTCPRPSLHATRLHWVSNARVSRFIKVLGNQGTSAGKHAK